MKLSNCLTWVYLTSLRLFINTCWFVKPGNVANLLGLPCEKRLLTLEMLSRSDFGLRTTGDRRRSERQVAEFQRGH